jgi:3-deoxy-D-manno-octulosonic-acid transferase
MYFIYSFIYTAAVLLLFIPQYLRRPRELRRKWLRDKLGLFDINFTVPSVWVHAVSVGEVTASIPFLNKLKALYPAMPVILSTVTDTGQKVAAAKVPAGTEVVYIPFDIGFILRRCIAKVRPRLFIVIETEIWPNIFRAAAGSGVPVVMLNGRLSEKSCRGYALISSFTRKVLGSVRVFGMQSNTDAERMELIGADRARIVVTGNFKFDMPDQKNIPFWAEGLGGSVIVAGSTHAGEEDLIISAFRENLGRFPGLRLILAPRHPERFPEVAELLRRSRIPFIKRTELDSIKQQGSADKSIILLDSIGELSAVYGAADIVVIGKSFLGHGGQNPLEAALWGKPVICGPNMENFPFMKEFYEEGAAFQVGPDGLAKMIKNLLTEPEKAKAGGIKARELYLKNSGAVDKSLEIIRSYLN